MSTHGLAERDGNPPPAITPGRGPACAACGGPLVARPALRSDPPIRPFALHACRICGLVQQHPRADADQLAGLYDETYYVFAEDEPQRWARSAQQYALHIGPLEPAGGRRLLDVGAALGHFAALAAARGWRATALDISIDAMRRTSNAFGIEAVVGELGAHAPAWRGCFDLVFLGDVLEHVSDPVGFLRTARLVLAPRGILCIDTPNWGGAWRRRGGRRWLGLNRFHINLFDERSLRWALTAAGLRAMRIAAYTHYRYECWADRPEPAARLEWLPAGLRWRALRGLRGLPLRARWRALRAQPPVDLSSAVRCVESLHADRAGIDVAARHGDNLLARAAVDGPGRSTAADGCAAACRG